ncbi:hypothetical protein F5Y07DRAFT_390146 [Xylaria sp. FL0933]|nr:hypothetical protein F5Y07DRAFT_390146 [Xylaria sp. FL0933]
MQFSFTTILAALAMATFTQAQYACEYIEALGGACNGYYPIQCEVQESPYPGTGTVTKCSAILNRGCGALWDLQLEH